MSLNILGRCALTNILLQSWIARTKVPVDIEISDIKVTSESRVKLLDVYIDNRVNLDYHVSQLCQKASKKLHALATIFKYEGTSNSRVLVNSFITSQFSNCPLIWMFHSQRMEHRINKIYVRTLRLIYPFDAKLTFQLTFEEYLRDKVDIRTICFLLVVHGSLVYPYLVCTSISKSESECALP